jgi:hypothetical protein
MSVHEQQLRSSSLSFDCFRARDRHSIHGQPQYAATSKVTDRSSILIKRSFRDSNCQEYDAVGL